jgi:rod shape-determining protein MreD
VIPRLQLWGVALGLLVLQELATALAPHWARPDLILVFALAMGLRARGVEGLVLAFVLGYFVDVLSGAPLGLHALLRGTACAVTRVLDRTLVLRAPAPWALYVAIYALVDALLLGVALSFLAPEGIVPWREVLIDAPGSAILTGLLALPLLRIFRGLDPDALRDDSWAPLSARSARP